MIQPSLNSSMTSSRASGIKEMAEQKTQKLAASRKSAPVRVVKEEQQEARIVDKEDEVIGGGFQSVEEIHDSLPDFLKKDKIKDKQGKRPDHPEYDPTSLYIPPAEWKNFTPGMFQYWELKQDNFEKIFFFKLGKFYEIFYNDAIICQRLLDLNWMGGAKKLHVGFPEKALNKYLPIMVN